MFKSKVASLDVRKSRRCSVAKLINGRLVAMGTLKSLNGLYGIVCPIKSVEVGLKSESFALRMRSNRGPSASRI